MLSTAKGIVYFMTPISVFICSVWCHPDSFSKPNFVIFLADDTGFGDLQCYGNPLSRTPNIDALEKDGLKFTQFYSAGPICSPARAGLLTGRYPVRSGVYNYHQNGTSVFGQISTEGLPHSEITIPEMLSKQGYKSALIGKWHLGVGWHREYLPIHHGFDDYFGIPGTHVDCPCIKCYFPNDDCTNPEKCNMDGAPCQLLHGDVIIEQPVNLITLAVRQARAARSWIQKYSCENNPFFLMYAFYHPHDPHFAGKRFRNSTVGGVYTDSLAELDWQVGEVVAELKRSGVIDNTLIIVTSDNGPALRLFEEGGFSGDLRCGKGSTFEGGSRVPTIAYWRGRISSGISTEFLSHMDIWPTLRTLSGSSPEEFNVMLDGVDFSDVLLHNGHSRRNSLVFYSKTPNPLMGPFAVRNKRYKIHFANDYGELCYEDDTANYTHKYFIPPLLYDLLIDPGEKVDISSSNESKLLMQQMTTFAYAEWDKVKFGKSVLTETDENIQLCCNPGCEPFPSCCVCVSNYTKSMFPLSINCGHSEHGSRDTC